MVPYHIDNGLYLIITPFPNQGLKLKTSTGQEILTNLSSDSVLILMGRALTDWLLKNQPKVKQFYPVPHAVDALDFNINARSIFARMKIAPGDAKIKTNVTKNYNNYQETFEDIFFNREWSGAESLCASDLSNSNKVIGKYSILFHRINPETD